MGAKTLFRRLEETVKGLYTPHGGWSQREYDLAFLAKALGGPRLLFAMQKAFGLPSTSTLLRNYPLPSIHICLSEPTIDDMNDTFNTMFNPEVRAPPTTETVRQAGKVLMMDDIAIEEVGRYDYTRDTVLGACREHTREHIHIPGPKQPGILRPATLLSAKDFEAIDAISNALDGKLIHLGKEATVLAIGSISDPENYLPIPVLLSTTCKAEKADALAHWLELFLDVWCKHLRGEALHGPIVTVASDGASTFRLARFQLTTKEKIDITKGYGKVLAQLDGLDLWTGVHGLLVTCDPKHVFKRRLFTLQSEIITD